MCAKKIIFPVLLNAEQMNRRNPEEFYIPKIRHSLSRGNYAKICRNGERFWVRIVRVLDGYYVGAVANCLVVEDNKDLSLKSLIAFAPCNVIEATNM